MTVVGMYFAHCISLKYLAIQLEGVMSHCCLVNELSVLLTLNSLSKVKVNSC